MSAQVADAMVQAVNAVRRSPVTRLPLAFAIQTGDNSDNCQYNEVRWNIDVLDGGEITPDSGSAAKYQGVAESDPLYYDQYYWHPEGTPTGKPDDLLRAKYGFPVVKGLLDAARRKFSAAGLNIPWYTAFGNHDGLVQGNFPHTLQTSLISTGVIKVISPPTGVSQANVLETVQDPNKLNSLLVLSPYAKLVAADPRRRSITRKQVVAEHFTTTGLPVGHGFTAANRTAGTAYYTFDQGPVRAIVLDTVNPNGYSDGSIDKAQFTWLKAQLAASTGKAVIVFSHHTSDTMTNPLIVTGGEVTPRVLGGPVVEALLAAPNVIAWVNGHTHRNQIWARPRAGGGGFWEINTASHIDWPQQSRLIEIADNHDGTWSIFTTMVDHAGPVSYAGSMDSPTALAGLARELALNDPQRRDSVMEGDMASRNIELLVPAPF